MATVFFWDTDGPLMTDYLHPGKTTIGQYTVQGGPKNEATDS